MHAQSLRSERARSLVSYVEGAPDPPYAHIVAAATDGDYDIVDLVVEPELPQHRLVAIRPEEPIRLRFPVDDGRSPTVHSQRSDFPINQVHTNYSPDADGLGLCIWEENWSDLRRVLSAHALVERIRGWFSRMATGHGHQEGQALEPLLPPSADTLIIPQGPPQKAWIIQHAQQHEGRWTVIAGPPSAGQKTIADVTFSLLPVQLSPIVHGGLRNQPSNLAELCTLAGEFGENLAERLREWLLDSERLQAASKQGMLLVLTIPKMRAAGEEVEAWEAWAFMPVATLSELGEALGCTVFDPHLRMTVARLPAGEAEGLERIGLAHWKVVQRLDRASARFYAGSTANCDRNLVAVGAGAIGSNVVIGTTRAGIGTWTIIDNDIVLPHNTVRQFQGNMAVGLPKAWALKLDTEAVLAEGGAAHYIWADVLNPGENADQIRDSFANADLVADFSASPAVLGHLSDQSGIRRAASFFFNPDGSDLVILTEDDERSLKLDEIEAQYFLAVASNPNLCGHLKGARLDFVRYANACQDITRPVPPWRVQTLSGIAGAQLLAQIEQAGALARVWRLDIETGAIAHVTLQLPAVTRHAAASWRLTVSDEVLRSMRRLRAEAKPNESGGILIGSFDLHRRIVHVVAALPAPPDSVQTPTYFVRGSKDLRPIVDRLAAASVGVLGYVGEWHSHPDRARPRPSTDDEKVDAYLSEHIGPTGAPHLIAICGKNETWFRLGHEGRTCGESVIPHGDG